MVSMKRSFLLMAATAVAGLALAATAFAAVIDVGATSTPLISYTCPASITPANCTIVLTRVTALPTISDGVSYPTKVRRAGRIVAFTVGLSKLSNNRATARSYVHSLDQTYGGTTQAAVTVLRPVGPKRQRRFTVVAVSEVVHLQPYLGQVVQIPLLSSLPVRAGDVVALSTPTWVPVLEINMPDKKFAYRQSRTANCNSPPRTSQAQLRIGQSARYICDYAPDSSCPKAQHHLCGTRVEFTATEVTTPAATK
jgi:hypothetical protein